MYLSEFANIQGFRPQIKRSLDRGYGLSVEQPSLSFSQCMGNSFRQTMSCIFSHQSMDASKMISGHLSTTLTRAQASSGDYLLAAQDTTYYNYSGHHQMTGLGTIQGRIKGLMQHNVLLMDEQGLPLGIIDQQYWTRKGEIDYAGSEGLKWERGLEKVNTHLGGLSQRVVMVEDREADIFEFFKSPRASNIDLLVRVYQPRTLEVVHAGTSAKLAEIGCLLSGYGTKELLIKRENKEVLLSLSIKGAACNVYPRKDLSKSKHKTQGLSVVIAEEIACQDVKTGADCYDASKKAIWYLLTSLPVNNKQEAERVVLFYSKRWQIERLHYVLKSGALSVEKLQFDDVHTVINAISFYSVVAWRLLATTFGIRENAEAPA